MFDKVVTAIFYVNIVIMAFGIAQATCVCILSKKTAYGNRVGVASVMVYVCACVAFAVQLVTFSMGNAKAPVAVYLTLSLFACAFIVSAVYCFVLSKRSNRVLCYFAGIFAILPPVGTFAIAKLTRRMSWDTKAQGMVFNGYAYTIAALRAFVTKYSGSLLDSVGTQEYKKMKSGEAFRYVKKLKKTARKTKNANDWFKYGEAVLNYFPYDSTIAIRAIRKAAKLGSASAQYNLGYMYEQGVHYKKDIKKAIRFYEQSAEGGDTDAKIRLGIVQVGRGKAAEGVKYFSERAKQGDDVARYNLAKCIERGDGVEKDFKRAIELYAVCAKNGQAAAQRRLFAWAAQSVNSANVDHVFRELVELDFAGEFGYVMKGVIAIKEKRASDGANEFLSAVKCRGEWEGFARLFVGTLYLDCGKLESDKINGAAYVKTAIEYEPLAKEVYLTIPKKYRVEKNENVKNNG